jgi:hypothetical protein
MTVAELGERMSAEELTGWEAWFALKHEDEERARRASGSGG